MRGVGRARGCSIAMAMVTFGLLAVGCGTIGGRIVPAMPLDVRASVGAELGAVGMRCQDSEPDKLICESDRTYKMVLFYLSESRRLVIEAMFTANATCVDADPLVRDFNQQWNVAIASCLEQNGTTVDFLTSILVPESGLNGLELLRYLEYWSDAIQNAAVQTHLLDILQ